MKVKTIKVTNFRGIDYLELPFEGKNTVLFGVNGVGKSAILHAINLVYANIISMLVSSEKTVQLELDDISCGFAYAHFMAEKSDASFKTYFS